MRILTPHSAAAAIARTKAALMQRPEKSLLLHTWSTKTTQNDKQHDGDDSESFGPHGVASWSEACTGFALSEKDAGHEPT
jgi:hypothetical protein